jgi:hypothetical protein
MKPLGMIVAILLAASSAWAQIIAPTSVDEHFPIVCRSEGQADVYIWQVTSPAKRLVVENGRAVHVWAPPGKYEVRLTTITIAIDWEKQSKDIQYNEHLAEFTVGAVPDPDPDPDPKPDPTPNPYHPDPALQAAVSPVKALSLSQPDSKALAEMYATVASQSRAGAFTDYGQLRAELVKRGSALSLKGKYAGLSQAVEQYLTQSLGLERETVTAERVGNTLETLAWAVFEAGRAK